MALATAATLIASASCADGGGGGLAVDLKTDLVAGRQFVGIRTEIGPAAFATGEASATKRVDRLAAAGEDYLSGRRVAELEGLTGAIAVRVTLVDNFGEDIVSRTTLLTIKGNFALTVLITGSCRDVQCPGPDDDTGLTACVGGRCVDPRCSPETPEYCGAPGCASASECSPTSDCTTPVCIDRECFVRIDDSLCAATEVCDPIAGCVLRPDADAGPGCPPSESYCTDSLDDDCDGLTDCADPDCTGMTCDDSSVCTTGDACAPDGTCTGTMMACDDGNPCTDDFCDPVNGCATTPNTATCDDGFWCNGPDTCMDGACTIHGAPPCPSFCNETTRACEECSVDTDCGTPTFGAWSACSYAGTCDESATRTRSVMTPRCTGGTCVVATTNETEACTRNTDGTTCGTTTYGTYGTCGGYSNACDETGSQSRSVTTRVCRSGSCASETSSQSRTCSRTVANGTSCGGMWQRCCGGACTDLTTNRHCGACAVDCTTEGLTCASTGTGGYACRGCSSNAQCQRLLNSAATCYNISSPPAFCQCQCASTGVCSGAGCGGNFYCHACPGTNFCSPTGGGC